MNYGKPLPLYLTITQKEKVENSSSWGVPEPFNRNVPDLTQVF
jgi:hypothetical protein